MVRCTGKQSGESVEEEAKEDCGGKDLQKSKVLSLEWWSEGVMDDEWRVDGTNGRSATPRIGEDDKFI